VPWVAALPMLELAYNYSFNVTVKSTPFILKTGLNPLHPVSTLAKREYAVPATAEQFVIKMHDELKRAKQCMLDAHTQKANADKHRKDIALKVEDDVMLATKNLNS
jgi:glycine cleavage system protein P-like pyridoxal-binding family